MGYRNAQEIFPEGLLKQIQRYVSGETIYIPAREERKGWGETSGYQRYIRERNEEIRSAVFTPHAQALAERSEWLLNGRQRDAGDLAQLQRKWGELTDPCYSTRFIGKKANYRTF